MKTQNGLKKKKQTNFSVESIMTTASPVFLLAGLSLALGTFQERSGTVLVSIGNPENCAATLLVTLLKKNNAVLI